MAEKIGISFKDNLRDKNLYLEVMKQNDKSAFIKNCIEFYLEEKKKIENKQSI